MHFFVQKRASKRNRVNAKSAYEKVSFSSSMDLELIAHKVGIPRPRPDASAILDVVCA